MNFSLIFSVSTTDETTRAIGGNNNGLFTTPEPISTTSEDPMVAKKHCCGCKFTDKHGQFETQFSGSVLCTWNFEAEKDELVMVTVERLSNFNWKQGRIFLASPEKIIKQFGGKDGGEIFQSMAQKRFTSPSNKMNLTLFTSRFASPEQIEVRFSYATFRGVFFFFFYCIVLKMFSCSQDK